jgi:hypothetical protein
MYSGTSQVEVIMLGEIYIDFQTLFKVYEFVNQLDPYNIIILFNKDWF